MTTFYSAEFGVKFVLVGPLGDRAVFNDPTDADYVGVLSSATGLDSPDVRESTEVLTEFDGAVQGPNYFGSRPIVLEGLVHGHTSTSARAAMLDKLMRASTAMRGDCTLTWTPSGGIPVYVKARRSQPLRVTGGWIKTFNLSLTAADPRIYSVAENMLAYPKDGVHLDLTNAGNGESFPTFEVYGPVFLSGGTSDRLTLSSDDTSLNLTITLAEYTGTGVMPVDQMVQFNTKLRTIQRSTRRWRVNYFPNPGFTSGTAALTALTNITLTTNQTAPSPAPAYSNKVCKLVVGGAGAVSDAGGTTANLKPTTASDLTTGDLVSVGWSALATTQNRNFITRFTWKDSGGSVVSTVDRNNNLGFASSSTSAWRRTGVEEACPAGATQVAITPIIGGGAGMPNGTIFYLSGLTIEGPGTDFVAPEIGFTGSYSDVDTDLIYSYPGPALRWTTGWDSGVDTSKSTAGELGPEGYWNDTTTWTDVYSTLDFTTSSWVDGLPPGTHRFSSTVAPSGGGAVVAYWHDAWF